MQNGHGAAVVVGDEYRGPKTRKIFRRPCTASPYWGHVGRPPGCGDLGERLSLPWLLREIYVPWTSYRLIMNIRNVAARRDSVCRFSLECIEPGGRAWSSISEADATNMTSSDDVSFHC